MLVGLLNTFQYSKNTQAWKLSHNTHPNNVPFLLCSNSHFLISSSGYVIFCILPASALLFTLVSVKGGKASTTGNQTGSQAFVMAPARRRFRTLENKGLCLSVKLMLADLKDGVGNQ